MKRQTSHIPRTLKWLRSFAIAEKCERTKPTRYQDPTGAWVNGPNRREDLFGVADIVAVSPTKPGTIYVQVCARGGIQAHFRKALEATSQMDRFTESVLKRLLLAGNQFWIVGWGKLKTKKKRCPTCGGTGMGRRVPDCSRCGGRGSTGGQERYRKKVVTVEWGMQEGHPVASTWIDERG